MRRPPQVALLFVVLTAGALSAVALASPAKAPSSAAAAGSYPWHTNIVSTSFWVGEIFDSSLSDGSQVCSTYDSQWAYHWSGAVSIGITDPSTDCKGAPVGGCDGRPSGTGRRFKCATEARTAANGYFPNDGVPPAENPFYLDLPFDDVNDRTAFAERCSVVPWASQYPATDCANAGFSYMKNRWVEIQDTITGNICYGQIEDAGPSSRSKYHDASYVFGSTDARPANKKYSGDRTQGDGMDVSPALNGCLGFKALDGDNDHVNWRFVDTTAVPPGPWLDVVTQSPVFES